MARHEVIIHENTSATKTVAPYLGNYIAKETLAMAAFASAIGAKCGLPAIQVLAILGGSFEAIEALEREGLVRIHTDIGVICAVIKGSFPTADAAFDPERNTLELALRLDDAIQLDLSDIVPVIVTDEDVTKLRVDNVMDLVEERPMNLIHGRHVFRVAGFNMVLSDEGAAAYLEDARGTTFPLVVDEVVSKQLFKAHTAELLPGGDYTDVVPQGEVPARGRSRASRPDERRQVQGDVLQGRRQRDGLHVRSRLDAGGQRSLRRRRAGRRVGVRLRHLPCRCRGPRLSPGRIRA